MRSLQNWYKVSRGASRPRVARCSLRSQTFARPFLSVLLVIAGKWLKGTLRMDILLMILLVLRFWCYFLLNNVTYIIVLVVVVLFSGREEACHCLEVLTTGKKVQDDKNFGCLQDLA